jgi:acyl dehydratase
MPLDLDQVGAKSAAYTHRYDWRAQATYALGIGAKRDELPYLYEHAAGGMKVFPTYAVIPAFEPVVELLGAAGVEMSKVVHGGQRIDAHRPIPAQAEVETTATLRGVYDMKRLASVVVATETTLAGEPLFATEWTIFVLGEGGFGGERPPKDADAVKPPRDRDPDFSVSEATSAEQALLYRISGDTNPLHADPAFAAKVGFPQGPILHGLCSFGYVARAVIRHGGGDATKLGAMYAQFRKPVWPGDTIVTQGWDVGGGKFALQAAVEGRPEPVVANAWATLTEA